MKAFEERRRRRRAQRQNPEEAETKAAAPGAGRLTNELMEENLRSERERHRAHLIARPQFTDPGHPFYQEQKKLKRGEAFRRAMTVRDRHRLTGQKLGDDATNKVLEFAGLNGGRKRKSRKNKGRGKGGPKKRKTRKKTRRRRKRKTRRRRKSRKHRS